MNNLETALFKEVVGHFTTGVVVVTASTPDGPVGFTSQTFSSLSLEPILVCFAASNAGQSWSRVRTGDSVGINVLSDEQEALARVFAMSGVDKFDGVSWTSAPHGAPLLDGAIAHLEGRIDSVATHGDHDIAVASVNFASAYPGRPLLYFRGGFGCLA